MRTLTALSLFILGLAGCDDATCTRQSDCPKGTYCDENLACVVPPADGGDDSETLGDGATDALSGDAGDAGKSGDGGDGSIHGGSDGGDAGEDAAQPAADGGGDDLAIED